MDAACVRSLLLTSSTSPRHAARPVSRSSSDGVTPPLCRLQVVRGCAGPEVRFGREPLEPPNLPNRRDPFDLRAAEVGPAVTRTVAAGRAARAVGAARAARAVAAAGRAARVAACFVGAAADRFARLVDHL